jgi:hypothetical protein
MEVEADDSAAAETKYLEEGGDYIGHNLGDCLDWVPDCGTEILPAEPHNLPDCMFYPESAESTCAEVKAATAADHGNAAIPHPNTDECTAVCNNTVPGDDWPESNLCTCHGLSAAECPSWNDRGTK